MAGYRLLQQLHAFEHGMEDPRSRHIRRTIQFPTGDARFNFSRYLGLRVTFSFKIACGI